MTFSSYYDLNIQLPDLTTQQKGASVLSVLDDKIELNNRINAELEALAKLLYEYWFVQFDFPYGLRQSKPADETSKPQDIKPYKSSGGKMVWNKDLNREIPEGWEVKRLGNVLKTHLGGTPSTKVENYWEGGIPWMNSGEVANFPLITTEKKITKEAVDNSPTRFLRKGSVLLSFKKEVLKSLYKRIINSVEAKQCLIRGFENTELSLFFDFEGNDPFRAYIEGLEKMNLIEPLFRADDSM